VKRKLANIEIKNCILKYLVNKIYREMYPIKVNIIVVNVNERKMSKPKMRNTRCGIAKSILRSDKPIVWSVGKNTSRLCQLLSPVKTLNQWLVTSATNLPSP
jgi:hypothetical protein